MEVQREGEEEDTWKDRQNKGAEEEERAERSTESTIHTVPELLLETQQVFLFPVENMNVCYGCVTVCVCLQKAEVDPEEMRREMELQLEAWHKLPPGSQEEVRWTEELVLLCPSCHILRIFRYINQTNQTTALTPVKVFSVWYRSMLGTH